MSQTDTPVLGMVLKGWPRISETFISNEIRLLERRGFAIRIISMRQPRESFVHDSVKEVAARVDYLPSEMSGNWLRLLKANWRALRRFPAGYRAALGKTVRRFLRSRKTASIKHLLQAGVIAGEILPDSGIGHLHAHFAHSPASVTSLAACIGGLPFSFTGHAKDIWTQKPDSLQEKIAEASFVVTCTGCNRDYLDSLNETRKPLYRVYHGIDLGLFSAPDAFRVPAPPYRILTIARLTTKKGLPTVFRALKRLADDGLPFSYCLIGDGESKAQTLALLADLGLDERTQWLGVQAHGVVMQELARADCFAIGCEVAPNGDRDGIPNVLVESMAMGVPVVATRVSGIPELVQDGITGLLVESGDDAAMAAAIRRSMTDAAYRERAIPAAAAFVREAFDARRCIEDLAQVYVENGLGPKSAPPPR